MPTKKASSFTIKHALLEHFNGKIVQGYGYQHLYGILYVHKSPHDLRLDSVGVSNATTQRTASHHF